MGEVEDNGNLSSNIDSGSPSDSSQPFSASPPFLHVVSYAHDPLAYLAQLVVEQHQSRLPDLTHAIILLSQARAAPWLRRELLRAAGQHGVSAVLGPRIETLSSWIDNTVLHNTRVTADETLELMLVEALLEYPDLYGQGSPYSLAASLLELFAEMTEHYVQPPPSPAQFQQQLEKAYGTASTKLGALSKEAALVHTLWQALHQQLESQKTLDPSTAHIKRLTQNLHTLPSECAVYVAGFHEFTGAEWRWLEKLSGRVQLTFVVQGNPITPGTVEHAPGLNPSTYAAADELAVQIIKQLKPTLYATEYAGQNIDNTLTNCINLIYDDSTLPLKQRARQCAADNKQDIIGGHIQVYEAANSEFEAHAIEIQVRRWLTEGLVHIGIVTENRRLARRLRALLERAGIVLQDAAGWALSTTSAATVIERWLQCIEEDFHYLPFLDFLKSPFVFAERDRQTYLQTVYRLEKSIILDENVAARLQRYQAHTNQVRQRLNDAMASYLDAIPPLLDLIEHASQPLTDILQSGPQLPGQYLQALIQSLQPLGVIQSLRQDAAGDQLLNLFDRLLNTTRSITLRMQWPEFRAWLGSHLEQTLFQPANTQGPVQLMSLAQSDLQQFDALVIAGAERQFLPGTPAHTPFFNDAVRACLGIPTVQQKHARKFFYFRRLLQSTRESSQQRILMTWTGMDNDEELIPSPWLEAIQSFHALAYHSWQDNKTSLANWQLTHLVEQGKFQWCDPSAPLPAPMAPEPAATAHPGLLPKTMSATSYQQIMNCPYQFFAARCLGLSPPEAVREMLQKDDYGRKVHLCLQAFHSNLSELPGPFAQPFNEQNTQAAVDLLTQISRQVFANDIEDNFIHRGWLKRWEELIPKYVQWQIQQSGQWRIHQVETKIKDQPLSDKCKITGQLDRMDQSDSGFDIIDYKTGKVPGKEDVVSGEAVQLPFYAMLARSLTGNNLSAARVEYLSLDHTKFGTNIFIEGEELNLLQNAVSNRLLDIMQALHDGQGLPAWGDSRSCKICDMSGLCRKGSWNETDSEKQPYGS